MDYRDFLSEYELIITNTAYWDSEKNVEYKEDGKPYRNELNYLLDSLTLTHDSVFLNEITLMPHFDLRKDKMEYITQKDEFESALIEVLKKGKAKITDQAARREVRIISVKQKKTRRVLTVISASWIVKDKSTQQQIFEKLIFVKMHDAF
jgi:hypothetical protein